MGVKITKLALKGIADRVELVSAESYARTSKDLHWQIFAGKRDLTGIETDTIVIPIEDASLDWSVSETYLAESTSFSFKMTFQSEFASRKKTLTRSQMLRSQEAAAHFASFGRQMGHLFARAPEDLVLRALKASAGAGAVTEWDGLSYFNASHRIHPAKASVGVFSNAIASKPIDESVTLAVAHKNLSDCINAQYSIPVSSGQMSARIVPKYLVVPAALRQRAEMLTGAQFFGSDGSTDAGPLIRGNGLTPVVMPELGAAFGGSDSRYYLVAESIGDIHAFEIGVHDELSLVTFNPTDDSAADELQEYTIRARGAMGIAPADPRLILRCN